MNHSFFLLAVRQRPFVISIVALLLFIHLTAGAQSRPAGWRDETHGRDAVPDYDRVFAANEVSRLDITITGANWSTVIADMTDMAGPFGAQRVAAPLG